MRLDHSRSLLIRLFLLAVMVLVPPMAAVSYRAMGQFEQGMIPEMDRKAAAIGRDLAAQVERAVGYGIPLGQLVGVDDFFAPVLRANPELRYLAVTDADGRVLYLNGAERDELQPHYSSADFVDGRKASIGGYLDLVLLINGRDGKVGHMHVGFDQGYIGTRLQSILYDVVMVMAVSLIVSFEILLFVVFFNITGPMRLVGWVVDQGRHGDFSHVPGIVAGDEVGRFVRTLNGAVRQLDELYRGLVAYIDEVRNAHFDKGVVERVDEIADRVRFLYRFAPTGKPLVQRDRQAADIRLPLFLFVFAEEVSRSFMPLYVREVGHSLLGLSPEMIMAIPIAMFMACIAIASPWAGAVTERVGSRKVFLMGLIPAVLGYVMTGFAMGVFDLIVWRAVTGFGYALVTVAGQTYIAKATADGSRAQGLGVYVGAVLTASICGTAIGGVLAERVGFEATFFFSAAVVLLSGGLVQRLMASAEDQPAAERPAKSGSMWKLFANWRFTVLMLFAAMPAKMALTGFMFFLVPVILWDSQLSLPEIARIVVLYPLVMAAVTWVASRLSDHLGRRAILVALGGLIGGGGLLLPLVYEGNMAIALAIVALGVSHGLSASSQLALLPDICWTECHAQGRTNVMAFVRTIERVGSTAGPILAAAFIPLWGLHGAVVALGAVVLAMAAVFALASGAYGAGPHLETEEEAA
jgi:MFS family permease